MPHNLLPPHLCSPSHSLASGAIDRYADRLMVLSVQQVEPESKIGISPTRRSSDNVSLADESGDVRSEIRQLQRRGS